MNKFFRLACIGAIVMLTTVACENVFTTSPYAGLRRDLNKMSLAQRQNFAREALASGNIEDAKSAFDALIESADGSTDAELNLLLVELGIQASGVSGIIPDLLALATSGDFSDEDALTGVLEGFLDQIDPYYALGAYEQLKQAKDNDGTVTEEQYLFVGVGLILGTVKNAEAESIDDLDPDDLDEIEGFLQEAVDDLGTENGILSSMLEYVNGL